MLMAQGCRVSTSRTERPRRRIASPHAMSSVQAGEVEAVHALTTAEIYRSQLVAVQVRRTCLGWV